MERVDHRSGKMGDADTIIVIGVVVRELEKEGVNPIQAMRIGKTVAKALEALRGISSSTDRHI